MKKLLSGNWIIFVIGISFITSTVLAIRNTYIIERNHVVQKQTELVRKYTQDILMQTMHGLDLGVRGFGLTQDDKLLIPYKEAIAMTPRTFLILDSLLTLQNYQQKDGLVNVETEIKNYINFSNEMIQIAKVGNIEEFTVRLKEDRGYEVWSKYNEFATPLLAFEDHLNEVSQAEYEDAIRSNVVIQITILILVMPMLFMFVGKVNGERRKRELVLKEVDTTDRNYVFNSGLEEHGTDITKRSLENVKRASEFISAIASGNYEVNWQGMTETNKSLNAHTVAGNLINLKERLKSVKQDDERRNWSNEGLAKFSDIVRTHQHNSEELGIKSISFLTQYIQAQQGSLFVIHENDGDKFLKLEGCYAFNRQKFMEKRIEIGSGLVGQTYLEGETVVLKQVPKGYTKITSGLGDATPSCIVVVPMKTDVEVIAVVEFATFNVIEPYQITFLEKAGEYLASAILSSRNTIRMKALLEDAALKEEAMRQREEELRQNMEELQATQEELLRRQTEFPLQRSA